MTPGLDLPRLRAYLDEEHPGLRDGDLRAELIPGGRSNLTYTLRDATHRWVLRRPPLGHVLRTAHDMGREHRVISALAPTAVPVPGTVLLCADPDVVGAPFYVMEFVEGTVYRTAEQTAALGRERAHTLAYTLVDVLADLHEVDPESVGLGDFGHPDGYLERQVRRWKAQLDASRSRDLPGIERLHARLARAVPARSGAGVVHGDYRLDNVVVDAGGRVAAVLDWEMATLGDPLADLGLLVVYWNGLARIGGNAVATAVNPAAGFPPGHALADRYARRRGADLTHLPWYTAFGYFKLAVIAEGIHYRFTKGQTVGAGFERLGEIVPPLVAYGHATLSREA
ncbi:phosphotransferase family protein [Phytohabitans suffuscus]|uniref:Acyl-CoA dehydrogenase n=1 Tax=Phytohabitans suffuscus TaxID=624315 RepID=A0A6F8YZI4_9ACTN|nr:phosphotransferase family protein [Phytohabitans suffuscus]BCB91476.1 acyl-CoA dehydrogenase [Phytohabitans suffuscus]